MILRNFLLSVKHEQMFLVILSFTSGICVRYHSQIVCKFALVAFQLSRSKLLLSDHKLLSRIIRPEDFKNDSDRKERELETRL